MFMYSCIYINFYLSYKYNNSIKVKYLKIKKYFFILPNFLHPVLPSGKTVSD